MLEGAVIGSREYQHWDLLKSACEFEVAVTVKFRDMCRSIGIWESGRANLTLKTTRGTARLLEISSAGTLRK